MTQSIYILGISAFYHDSAACLVKDGVIVAAAQEERFTRKKHDASFPHNAITYCFKEGGITIKDVTQVAFYEKPFLKFERLLLTYLSFAPRGLVSFLKAMPIWLKEKIFMKTFIQEQLDFQGEIIFPEHQGVGIELEPRTVIARSDHRDAPLRHGSIRVQLGGLPERALGFGRPKRVQLRNALIEKLLGLGIRRRDGEVYNSLPRHYFCGKRRRSSARRRGAHVGLFGALFRLREADGSGQDQDDSSFHRASRIIVPQRRNARTRYHGCFEGS